MQLCRNDCDERIVKGVCIHIYRKLYYQRNKEYVDAINHKWRMMNVNRERELQRIRYWKNPEHFRQFTRDWAKENADHVRRYRVMRRVESRIAVRNWRADPENKERYHLMAGLYNSNRRSRLLNACGKHSVDEWNMIRKSTNGVCPSCKRFFGIAKLTKDHIVPLIIGGSNFASNLQPLCLSCNSSKKEKVIDYLEGWKAVNEKIYNSMAVVGLKDFLIVGVVE